jgi:hypothetical protein
MGQTWPKRATTASTLNADCTGPRSCLRCGGGLKEIHHAFTIDEDRFGAVLACSLAAAAVVLRASAADSANAIEAELSTERQVVGSGGHFLTTVIVHSSEPTETGMIQRSTETIDLTGDLTGRILYQPTSVIDFTNGTLTNTGHQVFSGTVLGPGPALRRRVPFRREPGDGGRRWQGLSDRQHRWPKIRCELDIVVTGRTAEGNVTADYKGSCKFRDK